MEVGKTDVSELDDVDDVIDVLIKAGGRNDISYDRTVYYIFILTP